MTDIVNELRARSLRAEQEGEPLALFDEAAAEIERLRCVRSAMGLRLSEIDPAFDVADYEQATSQPQPAMTDEEREAVEWCVEMAILHATDCDDEIATLRGLLERL